MIGNPNYGEQGTGRDEIARDRTLLALSDPVRRRALRYLDDAAGEVSLSELAAHLADGPADRERTATSLHHVHLPNLDDCGLAEYDPEAHRVRATVPAAVEPYVDFPD